MKNIIITIFSIIAVIILYLLILLGFIKFIILSGVAEDNEIVAVLLFGIFSLIIGLILILYLLAKRNIHVWGKRLYSLYFALLAAVSIVSSITIYMRAMVKWDPAMSRLIIPYGFIVFIAMLFLALRKFFIALVTGTVIFIFAFVFIKGLGIHQLNQILKFKDIWLSKGWTMNIKEVIKKPSSTKICKPWAEKMNYVKHDEWAIFYEEIDSITDLAIENISSGMQTRKSFLDFNPEHYSKWPQFTKFNEEAVAAIKACPFIPQNENTEEQLNEPQDKDALIINNWSKGLFVDALNKAKNGEIEKSKEYCLVLHEISDKLLANGQFKLHFMYGFTIDYYSAVCLAANSSITGKHLNIAGLEFLNNYSISNMSFYAPLITIADLERISVYRACADLFSASRDDLINRIFTPPVNKHTFDYCIENLKAFTEKREWLNNNQVKIKTVQDWEPFLEMHSRKDYKSQLLNDVFYRITNRIIVWRVVQGVDVIMKYYNIYEELPESVQVIAGQLPPDISVREPINYLQKESRIFVVSSRGWAKQDYKGEKLGLFNKDQENILHTIGFTISLPEILSAPE